MKKIIIFAFLSLFIYLSGIITGYALFFVPQRPVNTSVYSSVVPSAIPTPSYIDEDVLWSLIQDWRTYNGLQTYIKDERLCKIAELRAPEIKNEIGNPHANFLTRAKEILDDNITVSENGTGAFSEQDALNKWLSSPPHRQALEYNWQYSCVACHQFDCVQIFSNFTN